jgi:hypothetical protein
VDGLVGDQLLQHRRRGLPIDPPELEEAAIEPRRQQVTQIGIEGLQVRLAAQVGEQVLAHRHQRRGAALRHVHAAKQLLAGRLGRLGELRCALGRGLRQVGLGGGPQRLLGRQEARHEKAIEHDPVRRAELAQRGMQLAGDRRAGCLAALRHQRGRKFPRPVERRRGRPGPQHLGVGAPTIRDRPPQPLDPGPRGRRDGAIGGQWSD